MSFAPASCQKPTLPTVFLRRRLRSAPPLSSSAEERAAPTESVPYLVSHVFLSRVLYDEPGRRFVDNFSESSPPSTLLCVASPRIRSLSLFPFLPGSRTSPGRRVVYRKLASIRFVLSAQIIRCLGSTASPFTFLNSGKSVFMVAYKLGSSRGRTSHLFPVFRTFVRVA